MSGTRILFVEDDTHVREAYADILGALGYGVVAVDDGARALAELQGVRPDLILLDLLMPRAELDGIAFLSRLATTAAGDVPIVILSALGEALAQEISPQLASTLRIAAILPKPVAIEALTREIERLVGPGVPR